MKVMYKMPCIMYFMLNTIYAQNVGIGNSSPLMKLHIASSDSAVLLVENSQSLFGNISTALYFKTGNRVTGAVKTIGESSISSRLGFFTHTTPQPNSLLERLSIVDNGNIGINTTNPNDRLEINGGILQSNGVVRLTGFRAVSSGNYVIVGNNNDYSNLGATNATVVGYNSLVSGGNGATAVGAGAQANGDFSVAIGNGANTSGYSNAVCISGYPGGVSNTANQQISMAFTGGYVFYSGTSGQGVRLDANQNAWAVASDSRRKENFIPIDGETILNKISKFNLTTWNYKNTNALQLRHYGPMAQDFYEAFGKDAIGNIGNDTTINQADFDGVNFTAIQALEKRTSKVNQQAEQITALQKENEELKARMRKLEMLVYNKLN